eukprot:SAG11_NODE_478_length_9117_cov_6.916168_9_plen_54_part_00
MRRVSRNKVHTRINDEPSLLLHLTHSISHLESFPPSSPLKFVLKYDLSRARLF